VLAAQLLAAAWVTGALASGVARPHISTTVSNALARSFPILCIVSRHGDDRQGHVPYAMSDSSSRCVGIGPFTWHTTHARRSTHGRKNVASAHAAATTTTGSMGARRRCDP
jgi:hypothetical protein